MLSEYSDMDPFFQEIGIYFGLHGGVCVAIAQRMSPLFIQKQVVIPSSNKYTQGILNVYAPSTASLRKQFWQDLLNTLLPHDHWCIAGDFNMTQDHMDQVGDNSVTIHGQELAI